MPTYPLQLTCLGVIYGTPALAAVFVALRIYTRRKLNLRLSWDDWLIILPTVLSIALIAPSHRHVKMWHIGIHIWDVDPNKIEPNYDEYYAVVMAFNLLNIPILPLVKASIILLLLRAGSVITWLKKVLYCILVFTIGSSLIPWFLYIFICPPQTGNTWKPRTFGGLHCMGRNRMGEMLIWVTCANLLTDLLILPIPFIIVRRMMSARLRSRLVVLTVFACSLAVTGIGAAKIYLSYRDRLYTLYNPDWTYPIDYCINHIENNVAIIVANIPILRGLVTRWVFNFRSEKIALQDRIERPVVLRKRSNFSEKAHQKAHRSPMMRKLLPCIDDFSSSLATPEPSKQHPERSLSSTFTTLTQSHHKTHKLSTYFSRNDRYECADSLEKATVCETVTSIGSAPTLVGSLSRESAQWDNGVLHAKRSSPTLRPCEPFGAIEPLGEIQPLEQVRMRSALDGGEFDFGEAVWARHAAR
ncbi:integral membrane protein [Stagonosporopsis vannaccii]|nr:integral membrane protein [Stagonosporopsis vannaccii]